MNEPIQVYYGDDVSHCFGCGRLNPHGHQLKTRLEGDETVSRFTPEPFHTAIPGYVYGGLIASLIDCHGTGTAAAIAWRDQSDPTPPRYVTASLKVDYLRPTPMGVELELRGHAREVRGRKTTVEARLLAEGAECARGEVVAVVMPETMGRPNVELETR